MKQAKDLMEVLREANQQINPKLMEMCSMGGGGGRGMLLKSSNDKILLNFHQQ